MFARAMVIAKRVLFILGDNKMHSVYSGYGEGTYLPDPGVLCYVRFRHKDKYFFTDATMNKDKSWTKTDGSNLVGDVVQWIPRSEILI